MPDECRIDRAKEIVNDRVISLLGGEEGGRADTAPLWVGLPITHDEGAWLASVAVREMTEKLAQGVPPEALFQGTFEWLLVVGIVAGQAGDG